MTVKTDKGESVSVAVRENAPVLRLPAGSKDLKSAPRIQLSDVSAGDRIAATIHQVGGKLEAGSVVVMTKSDIAQQHQREEEEWQKRGVRGIVSAVDPAAGTFTMQTGVRTVTVRPAAKADFRRYAPDSWKFNDARPGSIADIRPGDHVRVLGDTAGDGASISAERIVSGTFRQIAGTVSSVDPQNGEIKITDLATKKPVTVVVKPDSTLKKLPPMAAAMLARRLHGGTGEADRAASPGAPGNQARRGPSDINQMLDRLPAMPLAELKPGDAIMLSSTNGNDPQRVTAIMLLAGVEPLLTASPTATRDLMGGWMSGGGEGEAGIAQ